MKFSVEFLRDFSELCLNLGVDLFFFISNRLRINAWSHDQMFMFLDVRITVFFFLFLIDVLNYLAQLYRVLRAYGNVLSCLKV